jgi:hypothetical protein
MSEIETAVQQLSKIKDFARFEVCKVVSVNEAKRTVNATTVTGVSGTEVKDVMLMADLDDGILLIPAVDSNIIIGYTNEVQPYVMMYSELSKVLLIVGDFALEISNKIKLNGDEYGGMVKIQETVDALNRLETKVDDLITKYNAHIHITTATVGATPTPGTIAPTTSTETPIGTQTTVADLENETIHHGSGI